MKMENLGGIWFSDAAPSHEILRKNYWCKTFKKRFEFLGVFFS